MDSPLAVHISLYWLQWALSVGNGGQWILHLSFPVLAPEPFTKHIACISLGYYSDKRYLAKKVFAILPSLYSGDLEKQLSSVYECLYSLMCMLKNYLKIICNADDFNN